MISSLASAVKPLFIRVIWIARIVLGPHSIFKPSKKQTTSSCKYLLVITAFFGMHGCTNYTSEIPSATPHAGARTGALREVKEVQQPHYYGPDNQVSSSGAEFAY